MLDILVWYAWTQAFALGGWAITSRWLPNLPDHGYGISKAIGVMLGAFACWFVVTLGLALNNAGAGLLALAAVWAAGLGLRRTWHIAPRTWPVILAIEALFALAFVGWAFVRAYSPDIMSAGGEKFMESMMINAILRSPTFPPNDAWLSGFSISYYYFGYILFAMLIRLSGVAPAVGFNLGAAMIFALTVVSAFSIGYNLWGLKLTVEHAESRKPPPQRSTLNSQFSILSPRFAAGLLTAAILALMGNLGGLMGALKCSNALPQPFWEWLDVRDTATQVYACNGLAPSEFYGWWWDWSRVVKDTTPDGRYQETITETPIFSFVLGDNHPHVIALPFVLAALTLALYAFQYGMRNTQHAMRDISCSILRIAHLIVLPAIVFGGLLFMNTWDFPIYGALFVAAAVLGRWLRREPWLPALGYGLGVMALGYLIYLPWVVTFSSQARGIGVNLFNGTRFTHFFLIYAPFLITAAGYLTWVARAVSLPARFVVGRVAGLTALVMIAGLVTAVFFGVLSPQNRALAQELTTTGAVLGLTREQVTQRLLERVTGPWTTLLLGSGAAMCAVLILAHPRTDCTDHADRPSNPSNGEDIAVGSSAGSPIHTVVSPHPFVVLLFGAGALLTLAVEFVFLQDLFGTRMNTVFKFYYQAWTVWSVAGGFALLCLITARPTAARLTGAAALTFVAFGLLYPLMAIPARSNNFTAPPVLDGAAFLTRSAPDDARLIAWLNTHVADDARIVEAPPDSPYGSYTYEGRISTFTGLPTLLGWGGHEHQWRGTTDEQARRLPLIEQLYNTADPIQARAILEQFGVRYVIVGDVERSHYAAEGLAKFETLCATAFQAGRSAIYRCQP